ncbi:MAG: dihydroorotate dehydrogenase electron transfer subunit [Planctomycetaceae bacterium]|nr:dihydroorotate dehydrogenase electron transfer subunit [Planctomycetaceae bacterium]
MVGLVPSAVQQTAVVVEQEEMARDTFRLRLECPQIARQILPGQFFMLRPDDGSDPLLGRPFALYDIYTDESGRPAGIDFGYVVIGKLTALMADWKPKQEVQIWGPLGNGFPEPGDGHLMMVAGGIGQTPFLAVAREALALRQYGEPTRNLSERPSRLSLLYGVRSKEYVAGLKDFQSDGLEIQLSTDDGSEGHHGFVTELLARSLDNPADRPDKIFCCGPEPMMKAVGELAESHNVPCWLSLETPMACGFGICFSCVTKVKDDDGQWDYRRTCVEGPVFASHRLEL